MKNIRKHKILAWILAAVLMITSCPASVFADAIPTESGTEQQAVLTEGEPESSESVSEEAPAEGAGENQAAEADSSQSEDVGSETVQEDQDGSEQAESEQAEAPKEEQAAPKEEQTDSKEAPAKAKDATDSGKAAAAKAPAAKTDSSAEKKDEAEEEENSEADLVGAPPVALTSMTESLSVSADPTENVGRGDTITLSMAFALRNMAIPMARNADYWTYDLSSVVGTDQSILSLLDGEQGALYQGTTDRGHYEIHGNEIQLYVDKAWLRTPGLSNVSGTFNLSANLNEDVNATKDEASIQFPGANTVTIDFEDRTLATSKKVGTSANSLQEKNDGGKVQVVDNGDGTYNLYYSISAKPNAGETLSVTDLLSDGQMLNAESLKLTVDGTETAGDFGLAQYGNGFILNIGTTKPGSEYVITYFTTINGDQLDKNQTNQATWNWSGEPKTNSTDVTPAYDYILDAQKLAGETQYNLAERKDGVSVELTEKNEDGTYNIWYSVEFKANKSSSTLKVNDTMAGGQTLVADSLEIYKNYNKMDPQPAVTSDGSGFSVDLGGADADVLYQIKYKTTVTEDQIEAATRQTNSAEISWDKEPVTVTTDLTPSIKKEQMVISKEAVSGVYGPNNQNADAGDTVEFKIVIGKDGGLFDYAGVKLVDKLQEDAEKQYVEYVPDSFTISPNIGGSFVLDEGSGAQLFTYTFPTDGTYTGKYEITYKVKIKEDVPNDRWIHNIGEIGEGPGAKKDDYGIQMKNENAGSLDKKVSEWDLENNTIYWTITIKVPEGSTLTTDLTDKDAEIATDSAFSKNKSALTVKGSQAEITYEDGSAVPADVISMDDTGKITIKGLTKTANIKVPAVASVNMSELSSKYGVIYTHNTVEGNINNTWESKQGTDKHTTNEYEMTKTGTIDKNGVMSWTVTLNPRKSILDPDHVPYFKDELPEGTELVGKIKIVVDGVDSEDHHSDWGSHEKEVEVTPSGGVIGPFALNEFSGVTYAGLSGLTYTITYQTKITDEEMARIQASRDTYTYSNSAAETDPSGNTPYKTASDSVEYVYTDQATVSKEDTTGNPNRGISYKITVNESGAKINGGDMIHVTDRINTNVSLTTNTVKVTDLDGNDLSSVIIGYNDDSRILEVLIPDETPAIITFSCRPLQKGTQEYSNTAIVQAAYKVQDSVSENHRVTDTGGTITGEKNTITLSKIDQYNLTKTLSGAIFELYECVVDDDGIIESYSLAGEGTTEADGSLVFTGIKNNTLYFWKEVVPPTGYLLADDPHYFITYAVGKTDAETAANRQKVWEMDDKITAANGITVASVEDQYFWLVTDKPDSNAMVELKGEKTLSGRSMEDDEFEFVLTRNDPSYPLPEASDTVTVNESEGTATVKSIAAEDGEASPFNFGTIKFTEEGNYYYQIQEKVPSGSTGGVSYDRTVYDVKVEVAFNEVIGILVGTVTYTNSETGEVADSAVFNNEYAETTTTTTTEKPTTTTTEAPTTTTTETTTTTTTETTTTTTTETTTTTTTEATTTTTTEATTTTTTEATTTTTTEATTTTTTEATTTTTTEATTTTTTEATTTTTTEATTTTTEATTTTTTEATTTTTTEATTTTTEATTTTTTEATTTTTTEATTTTTTEATTTTTTQSYVVNKVDAGSGDEVDGAVIALYEKDDAGNLTPIERWVSVSGETHDFGDKLEAGHNYVLREITAPTGYGKVTTDIEISVSADGKLTSSLQPSTQDDGTFVYLIEDTAIRFNVNKTDVANGEELDGAVLTVFEIDAAGNEKIIDSWTSAGGMTHDFGTNLEAGKSYVLREETAPTGYQKITTDIAFTVNEDGTITTGLPTATDSEGNVVYLVQDSKLTVKVSKVDVADGKEIAGARIQLFDELDQLVDEWTSSDTEAYVIEGIQAGITYTLKETIAPEGYEITSNTTFSIDEEGNITSSGTVSDEGVILIEDAKTSVKVSKVDVADGKEVAGATIQVIDSTGKIVDEWTSSDKEVHTITGLKTGVTYTLKETVAPDGYTIATETTFSLDAEGKVTSSGTVTTDGVLLVEDAKTKVKVSKTDIADGKELEGATIQILDEDGNVVDEWTSSKEVHEIEGLKTGVEYTLKETVAPDGYAIASETTFTIDETGKVTSTGTVTEDGVMLVEDAKTKVKVSKTDIADGAELEGATIQILDKDGNVVDEWTSSKEVHEIEGLKTGVEYTLKETVAPDGYTIASETTFTIDKTGKVTSTGTVTEDGVMLVEDAKTKVKVSKTDIADGAELEGATIQILDKDGNVVDEWTSGTEAHEIEGLKTGVEYTLKETVAPDGYTIASETTFTIDETGKVTSTGTVTEDGVMLVEDAKTKVKVSKTDIADGKELEGATIQILDKDGNIVLEWTSGPEATEIEGLKTGVEYTLKETVAPDGYTIASETTFTIDETGKVTSTGTVTEDGVMLVEDEKTKVKVSKTDIADGAELEGATIQILDENGDVVIGWISGPEATEIEGLKTGVTYVLKEVVAPDGYTIASQTTFTIDEAGKVTSTGTVTEDGVMLVEDAKTKVKVSKTDIADGKEIEGATIQILDKDGNVVDEWTSGKEAHEIEGLKTNEEYTLKETVAPDGYTIASETTFTIDETGKVTSTGTVTEDGVMLVEDAKTKVKVSKTDIADGEEIEGATIQILDKDGNVVEEWTSGTEAHEIEGLKTNEEYTLKETVAPDGYTIASETTFTIDETGKVTSTGTITEDGVMLVEDAKTKVKVSKTDIADGEEIEGATIQILDKDGNVVEEWTSGTEAHEIEGLKTNEEYTLKETVAPDGYTIARETTFTIDETGKVTSTGTITEDGVMLVEDAKTKVKVSKTDIADGKELEGATIQILDENGDVVIGWISGTEAKEIEGLKTGVTYVLKETVAPDGYTIASQTTFTIDETGKVTSTGTVTEDGVMLVEDAKTKVKVSKTDIADGKELEGATIQILDKDGNVVEEWTSGTEAHEIEGLKTGEEYTLKETVAPDGYTIASETTFTIDETGKVTSTGTITEDGVMLVEDAKTKVKVSKTDIADGAELEGATIQILDKDGNVVEEWTSGTEAHEIEGLKTNEEYTLKETVAPDGYTIASETKFTIDETGKVTSTGTVTEDGVMLVEDAKTKVKVSKTDIADGKELEGATIQILDENGKVVEEWISGTEAHEIEGLKTGVTYTLKETVAPDGYAIASETTFTIDEKTGEVTSTGTVTEDGVVLVEDAKTKVKVAKVDKNGKALEGAKLQVVDKSGKTVDEWTTGKDVHEIEGLNPGEYTLKETAAPSGYKVAAPIAFTLEKDGTVKVNGKAVDKITMVDEKATTTTKTTKSGGPGKTTKKASAKTGDTNNVLPFAVMAAISAGAIVGVATKKKKEEEDASEEK